MPRRPKYARPGAELPRQAIFRDLRARWMEAKGNTSARLSELMGLSRQKVSDWASEVTDKSPPWWAILLLCHELGLEVRLAPGEVRIERPDGE